MVPGGKMIEKIPFQEFQFEYVRSRGPGGQNVNRTNSAVQLRWNVDNSVGFLEEEKYKIKSKLKNIINSENEIVLRSDSFRDQDQNRKAVLKKLDYYLQKALFAPKIRHKTKPTRASVKKRLKSKTLHSQKKELRKKV